MSSFYRIKGLCKALDGLVVEAEPEFEDAMVSSLVDRYHVLRVFDVNHVVGDREASAPVTPKGLYIQPPFLESADDPTKRQYAADSPYGAFVLESRTTLRDIEVCFSRYERAMQVSIREVPEGRAPKTVYSENFNGNLDLVQSVIVNTGIEQLEDLIFMLQEIKEEEKNGQAGQG